MRIFLFILLLPTFSTWGQFPTNKKIDPSDSIVVKTKIENFYRWYGELIKKGVVSKEFSPLFIETKDGMTGLDFSKYKDHLIKNDFTDIFITRKINEYKTCSDNLAKVKYKAFLKFTDLDQYENIKCAFNNVHEWTSDMEGHDGAELKTLVSVDKNKLTGTLVLFNLDANGKKFYWDYKRVTVIFLRQNDVWRIDDLKVELL